VLPNQHKTEFKRGNAVLDLIFSCEPENLGTSNHNMVHFSINHKQDNFVNTRQIHDYNKGIQFQTCPAQFRRQVNMGNLTSDHPAVVGWSLMSLFSTNTAIYRDRTNQPLLFRDRISNCTNLFQPKPNRTTHADPR